jgi:hypothetical protein
MSKITGRPKGPAHHWLKIMHFKRFPDVVAVDEFRILDRNFHDFVTHGPDRGKEGNALRSKRGCPQPGAYAEFYLHVHSSLVLLIEAVHRSMMSVFATRAEDMYT